MRKNNIILKWMRKIYAILPFKKPVFQLLRHHVRLKANVYQHLHFVAPIEIPINADAKFLVRHFGAQVENDLFWAGYGNGWEATSLRIWVRLAVTANTIFDIGSNSGVYALAAKATTATAHVVAFEPVASIFLRLQSNVKLNGYDIEVVQAAASSTSGEAVMYIPSTDHSYSASLNAEMLSGQDNLVESLIQTVRIDSFLKYRRLASLDLVKIDTEKHEFDVLSGFGDVIQQFRPAVLIEILDQGMGKDIEPFFAGLGYVFYEIIEGKGVRRIGSLGISPTNHLLCPNECAAFHGLGDFVTHDSL